MQMHEFNRIVDFLFDPNGKNSEGMTRINDFCSAIKELGGYGASGARYQKLAEDLPQLAAELRVGGFPDDVEEMKALASKHLYEFSRFNRRGLAVVYVAWLFRYFGPRARSLLDELEFDWGSLEPAEAPVNSATGSIDAFLCWTGDYAHEVAKAIKRFFDDTGPQVDVFLSSVDIKNGAWEAALKNNLKAASRGLLLVTQDLLDSEYLEHEFAILSTKTNPPEIIRLNAPRAVLSPIMQRYQDQEYSPQGLKNWVEDVLRTKGLKLQVDLFNELIEEIDAIRMHYRSIVVTDEENRWSENLSRPLLMAEQNSSPYDLKELIKISRERLILVAQNHWFMTNHVVDGDEVFWPLVRDALRRGVEIDIVSMTDEAGTSHLSREELPSAYDIWAAYLGAPAFSEHADGTWSTLETWAGRARELSEQSEKPIGRLRIFGAYFTPLTISVVDPNSDRGLLVLSPRINCEASMSRPHFILRRRFEERPFKYYSQALENSFGNAGWIQKFV